MYLVVCYAADGAEVKRQEEWCVQGAAMLVGAWLGKYARVSLYHESEEVTRYEYGALVFDRPTRPTKIYR